MSQGSLPAGWLNRFVDPYAVLGIAVTADDRRVLKRYRTVARLLHPDGQLNHALETQHLATQLFAKLINPAYEKLKQEKNRKESYTLLRLQVRQLTATQPLNPKSARARQLMKHPAAGVDVLYEQTVAELAEQQFNPLTQFEVVTQELIELNQVYLRLKISEAQGQREKPTGLVPAAQISPIQVTPVRPAAEVAQVSYDRRHFQRAQEYMKKKAWDQAIHELEDALRLDPHQSDYHALRGIAHFCRNGTADRSMARAYLKQALKLNPQHPLATKYAPQVGLEGGEGASPSPTVRAPAPARSQAAPTAPRSGGLFGGLFGRKSS